jgi:hypothetical protein
MATQESKQSRLWPALPYAEWKDTCETLHLMTQVVGKVRLSLAPWLNHSWHATLYVTPRGLTTSSIPCGSQMLEMDFDFLEQVLEIRTSQPKLERIALQSTSIAAFKTSVLEALERCGIDVKVSDVPNEIPGAIRFSQDTHPRIYDGAWAERYWRALVSIDRVFEEFRTGFLGKVSPVHLFWGSMDLAVTRFSGRRAPMHPGGMPGLPDSVTREAYSHEVSSAGFWPGDAGHDASFYSYSYPAAPEYGRASVWPHAAYFDPQLNEFLLSYDAVRTAGDPRKVLLGFLESTYLAAATTGSWDRELECHFGRPGVVRQAFAT